METISTRALEAFNREPVALNCAQAVVEAYELTTGRTVGALADFKPHGGGRAPGNECGALYAACQCMPDEAEALRAGFGKILGAGQCRTLKRELRVSCDTCVQTAVVLLAEADARRR